MRDAYLQNPMSGNDIATAGKLALMQVLDEVVDLMQDAEIELEDAAEGSTLRVMYLSRLTALGDVKGLIEDEIESIADCDGS